MSEEVKNEFEDLSSEEEVPQQEFNEVPNDLVDNGNAGTAYDWSKAPEGSKAPPRESLDGQTVTITKAEIILPPKDKPWDHSRDGKTPLKYCTFKLYYSEKGQQEFYSGVRVFKRDGDKYSHPTIMREGKNQASLLWQAYAKFKGKNPNEVSLREFMGYLNSQPKVVIEGQKVTNPTTGEEITKNMVKEFV